MTVVSNSSPLITLATNRSPGVAQPSLRARHDSRRGSRGRSLSPGQVCRARPEWRKRHGSTCAACPNPAAVSSAQSRYGLGRGEIAAILLAEELSAHLLLLDDLPARRLARSRGLRIRGSVGILEAGFRRGDLADLRQVYAQLLQHRCYVERRILNASLSACGLPPL